MAKRQVLCAQEAGKTCETLQGVGDAANYSTSTGRYFVIFVAHGYLCIVRPTADRQGGTIPGVRDLLIARAQGSGGEAVGVARAHSSR